MSELYGRDYQILFRRLTSTEQERKFFVSVPDTAIEIRPPFAMSFTCEKTLKSSTNTLDMKLYNLAPRTRAELQLDGIVMRFAAGYEDGGPRRLFVGDVKYANSEKKGTEWVTEIQVRDGLRATQARVDKSFARGTRVIEVLRFVSGAMQLVLPKELEASRELQEQFAAGYAMSGKAREELSRLLAPFGYAFSIQDGTLVALRDEDTTTATMRTISVAEGMIESPEFGKPEAKGKPPKRTVSVKLYPELQPGGKVDVVARDLSGLHKIVKLRHTGDFQTDEWKTQVEVEPIK